MCDLQAAIFCLWCRWAVNGCEQALDGSGCAGMGRTVYRKEIMEGHLKATDEAKKAAALLKYNQLPMECFLGIRQRRCESDSWSPEVAIGVSRTVPPNASSHQFITNI